MMSGAIPLMLISALVDAQPRNFACQVRSSASPDFEFSGKFEAGKFASNLFAQIGEERDLPASSAFDADDIQIEAQGHRRSWKMGHPHALPNYTVEMTEFPGGKGHVLITKVESDGGRHRFEKMIGFGSCNIEINATGSIK